MKIGVSTWLWTSPFTTQSLSLLAKIRAVGFDFVEIAAEDPSLIEIGATKDSLAEHGLGLVLCGAWGPSRDLTSSDANLRRNSLKYIRECLDLCAGLGGKIFAGPMYSAVGKRRLLTAKERRAEWRLAVGGLREASVMAADRGVRLAVEPLNRFETDLVNTAAAVMTLLDDVDHPAAGVMLDSYHMAHEERDMEAALVGVGGRLVHVQVSDNYRGCPGKGQIRWDAFARGIQRSGYTGGVSIESFTPDIQQLAEAVCFWRPVEVDQDEFARDGLAFLRQLFPRVSS